MQEPPRELGIRPAGPADAEVVGALHAESWRRHYRGAYADAFLDDDLDAERTSTWAQRLRDPPSERLTILAEQDGRPLGFASTVLAADPVSGALLDNLHVAFEAQRRGIGRRLMARSAEAVGAASPGSGLFLWVLEQNHDAQAFYAALGGRPSGREPVGAPGGVPGRLAGTPWKLRYSWADVGVLMAP